MAEAKSRREREEKVKEAEHQKLEETESTAVHKKWTIKQD